MIDAAVVFLDHRHRGQQLCFDPLAMVAFLGQCIGDSCYVFAFILSGDVQWLAMNSVDVGTRR